jgi:peptidoglycan hydrolase-like protein with peptidoglycan-binding domain
MGRSVKVTAGVALAAAGAAAIIAINRRAGDTGTPPVTSVATATVAVRVADLAERYAVAGTMGYAGSYNVIAPGPGLLTAVPADGTTVSRGQTVYETDGKPVVLMYGSRPAWRPLQSGMSDGADVQQLETNLKDLGYGAGVTVDQHFTSGTAEAIRRWQRAAHQSVTGTVLLGQVVFMPSAVRISGADVKPGEPVEPGAVVVHGTSDQPAITVQLSPQQVPEAHVGDAVVVTLPDRQTRPGRITSVGTTATQAASDNNGNGGNGNGGNGGGPTVPVTVQVDGATAGFVDQAQVQVAITVAQHPHVLAVPITALNALPGGAYEVIVVDGTDTRRIAVQTHLFDEFAGLVEVTGDGLAEGQKVQVPRDES